ncbi:hypothetical protein IT072_02590 [Leifsonia sp. ZF2019]|uniref:hypothetical protein n=1 Tax=Leifsonia sp. ZF2019 TaxID=2781978 RepID=UPI001CBB5215|nr:hypothetical protein [Leifsonia sp. ZF2019]UAJ79985.1 hypothetical protein IT072_02590 [Leifsonia sp. ZF2019]
MSTKLKTNLDRVRAANSELRTILNALSPDERLRPRIHAFQAIVNADEIDRRTGITREAEHTAGLTIALEVLAGAR